MVQEWNAELFEQLASCVISFFCEPCNNRWVSVNHDGERTMINIDKHEIMRWVGIYSWDLRILNPMLSYPSKILGRETVIVINLEVFDRMLKWEIICVMILFWFSTHQCDHYGERCNPSCCVVAWVFWVFWGLIMVVVDRLSRYAHLVGLSHLPQCLLKPPSTMSLSSMVCHCFSVGFGRSSSVAMASNWCIRRPIILKPIASWEKLTGAWKLIFAAWRRIAPQSGCCGFYLPNVDTILTIITPFSWVPSKNCMHIHLRFMSLTYHMTSYFQMLIDSFGITRGRSSFLSTIWSEPNIGWSNKQTPNREFTVGDWV